MTKKHLKIRSYIRAKFLEHGLGDWQFTFINKRDFYGRCYCRYGVIVLSKYYTDRLSFEFTRQTILHEIAHAIIEENPILKDKLTHGHDEVWHTTLESIGGDPGLFDDHGIRIWFPDEKDYNFIWNDLYG